MSGLSAEIGRKIRDAVDFHRAEGEDHSRLADDIDDAWQQHDYEWLHAAGVISAADLREIERAMMAANPRRNSYPGGDPRKADALNAVFRAQLKKLTGETPANESFAVHSAITAAHAVGASKGEIDRAIHDAFKESVAQAYKPRKRSSRRSRRNGGMNVYDAHKELLHIKLWLGNLLMAQLGGPPPKDITTFFDKYEKFHTQPPLPGNPYQAYANIKSRRYWASIAANQDLTSVLVQVQIGGRKSKATKDFYFPLTAGIWPEIERQVKAFTSAPVRNKRTSRRPR